MIEFISITVLTFAMALLTLGVTTMLLERGRGRQQGIALAAVGLLTGAGYAFLGSRFALKLFGRLLVRVDLPALMATTLIYTAGVLLGSALAGGLFLWATGRFRDRVERIVLAFVLLGVLVALVATFLAVVLSSS
jgi:ABC-type glycerol-3-phosphate transport system permease component